jgi:ABC-2 type transport system ATP-binding protein
MNVTRMIKQLSGEHGVTVFLCTHQLKYAEEICTLYGFIHEGKMLGMGTFDELLEQKNSSRYIEIRGDKLPEIRTSVLTMEGRLRIPIKQDADVTRILQEILSGGERCTKQSKSNGISKICTSAFRRELKNEKHTKSYDYQRY